MAAQKNVLIVGGGIIGLCSAYYLIQEGHQVTVLDKSDLTDGCSFGNAGMIVPSHFIPLAAPGMIAQGIKWMFNSESPFYVKPRLNWDLISWGLKFYKAATDAQVNRAMPVLRDLNVQSRNLYAEMAKLPDLQFAFEPKGLLMLCKTEHMLEEESHVAETAHALGMEAKVMNLTEVHALEPEVKPDVLGGVFYPGDAHLHPTQLVRSLKQWLVSKGVRLQGETEAQGFDIRKDTISTVVTNRGDFKADEIVIAGGSWSQAIVRQLALRMPVQAGKGYSITMDLPAKKLRTPSILTEARVAITPMGEQLRIGGTMEIGGINQEIDLRRFGGILKSVPKYLPDYQFDIPEKKQIWSGLRPCSPDGLPYIGRLHKLKNVIIASGHAMLGLSLGPVTGKLVTELISQQSASMDISLLSPERFN
jgi:D-amino-acid dehydrogenase